MSRNEQHRNTETGKVNKEFTVRKLVNDTILIVARFGLGCFTFFKNLLPGLFTFRGLKYITCKNNEIESLILKRIFQQRPHPLLAMVISKQSYFHTGELIRESVIVKRIERCDAFRSMMPGILHYASLPVIDLTAGQGRVGLGMEISELFSHTREVIYFNHASSSPLAVPTRERMKKLVDELEFGDLPWEFWCNTLNQFREEAAKLLGCSACEICFVPNTTTGLLIALYSIPWPEESNIVLVKDGFPANRVPWMRNLRWIAKRLVSVEGEGSIEQRIMDACNADTRVVAVDWVDFFTGYRINLGELGDFCKERRIFLVVDGIQGAGAVELDLSGVHVDFFAAQSAKWLLGPLGAGLLYINNDTQKRLKSAFHGWMSLDWKDFNIFDPLPPIKKGAARFEPGSNPGLPLIGFVENLKLLNSVGISEIARKILELRSLLLAGLGKLGAMILSPVDGEHISGILTFRIPERDSRGLWQALNRAKIKCSLRKNAIRLSPHFYNTADEATRVLNVIRSFNNS